MDWKKIISELPIDDKWDTDKKDIVCENLITLKNDKIIKKYTKKLFEIAQQLLYYKNEIVNDLQVNNNTSAGKELHVEGGKDEKRNELNKKIIQLEDVKIQNEIKILELNNEINALQKKIKNLYHDKSFISGGNAMLMIGDDKGGADAAAAEDSPDVLSEVDREEELYKNINMKNKHIKKLLKDIEQLEGKNLEKSKTINDLQTKLYDISGNLTSIVNQNNEKHLRIQDQERIITDLNETIENLNNYIERYVKENCQLEQEVMTFSKQLEERAMLWKQTIQDKETELLNLQMKYDKMLEQNPGYDIDMERIEFKRLSETLTERNQLIDELQTKLMHTTNEMITSTKFMNELAQEREINRGGGGGVAGSIIKDLKNSCCCDETKELLHQSNKRCKELQEMMQKTEEENVFKSKQAMNALEILQNYQSGDPGLAKLLKNNTELEYKCNARDKQIKTLIMELNSLQDTAEENYTLRKQLGVPENMNLIPKNSYMAKEKRFQKVINRLIQKLRASEEMRLQLKLEKNTLKRSMTRHKGSRENIMENDNDDEKDSTNDSDVSFTSQISNDNNNNNNNIEIKFCEHCLKQYEIMDLFRTCKNCTMKQNSKFCMDCCEHFKIGQSKQEKDNELNEKLIELDKKYTEVIDENENLRIGLHEIVAKLRDYDANSTNITIDTVTVERLLHALDARSVSGWYHPAMRIQNELIASKERELALKERLKFNEKILNRGMNSFVTANNTNTPLNIEYRNPIIQNTESNGTNNKSIEHLNQNESIQEVEEVTKQNTDYFQIFLQHIEERDMELNRIRQQLEEITTNYRNILLETIELNGIIKENSVNKTFEIDTNTNADKIQLDKCNKKLEFLKIDYDILLNGHRQSTDQYQLIMYELKKELCDTKNLIGQLRFQLKQFVSLPAAGINRDDADENQKLKEEIIILKLQLSKLSAQFFMNIKNFTIEHEMDFQMKIKNQSTVINGNLTLEFITRDELNQLKIENSNVNNELEQLRQSNEHLTNRIQLQQEQLQLQQHSIRKRTEEEIHLKHVLVDLQCENMEKFIIAKHCRDIEQLKGLNLNLEKSVDELNRENQLLNEQLKMRAQIEIKMNDRFTKQINNYDLKLQYLKKSLIDLQQNYNEFIPLYSIVDFIQDYGKLLKKQQNNVDDRRNALNLVEFEHKIKSIIDQFQTTNGNNGNFNLEHIEDKINAMKYQSQCNYLEKQLRTSEEQITNLYELLEKEKLKEIQWSQHWHTIELLFNNEKNLQEKSVPDEKIIKTIIVEQTDKETQTIIEKYDRFTETDDLLQESLPSSTGHEQQQQQQPHQPTIDIPKNNDAVIVQNQLLKIGTAGIDLPTYKSMESQLKQALILASTRSSLLLDTENHLVEMQSKNKMLEKLLESKEAKIRQDKEKLKNFNEQITSSTTTDTATAAVDNGHNGYIMKKKDDGILSETINSLQMLLIEKDQSIVRYQELLKIERDDLMKSYNEYRQNSNKLQSIIQDLEYQLQMKEKNINSLTEQLATEQQLKNATAAITTATIPSLITPSTTTTTTTTAIKVAATSSNEYSQLSDKFIEDMFRNDQQNIFDDDEDDDVDDEEKDDNSIIKNLELKLKQYEIDKEKIQNKLNELNKREKLMESRCLEKDHEISELNERLNNQQLECINITENIANHREIDQLKEFLQEKDKHIQDLTDTLKHFHDDQQQFINDTTMDTVEQVTQLNADLNRSVATNRILMTQIEALKRQITSIGQRETQARDLIKTLKNQLIKRPVISIKQHTDRNAMLMQTTRDDHLQKQKQKRIEQLEHEINVCREELDKQIKLASVRRLRDTTELGLWERQKRAQQQSEKFKVQLNERDGELEKLRNNFTIAKNTITRLEREKLILENRLKNHGINVRGLGQQQQRYCQTPSCPNIHTITGHHQPGHHHHRDHIIGSNSSSIDIHHTNTGDEDDDDCINHRNMNRIDDETLIPEKQSNSKDLINLLKSRIEVQQRKIIAMELEGKGTNQLTIEFEKLQKRIATLEAQNLRLEAKNLQYQLDLDMLRQNDFSKRTNQQIKHLEDYILSLKEELSRANALNFKQTIDENPSGSGGGNSSNILNMQQTILALRRVIERLKVENKNLKDGKPSINKSNGINGNSGGVSKEKYDKLRMEFNKIQRLYSEALDKISALQIELEIQNVTCNLCKDKIEKNNNNNSSSSSVQSDDVMRMTTQLNTVKMELQILKEKLIQKSQLLEKAKILLTRAAVKDKHLREQTIIWKRRFSELQNVPVIDEASE